MIKCYGNKDEKGYFSCQFKKTVEVNPENEHEIVERSDTSWSSAWCTKHDCPCKDKDYYCSEFKRKYLDDEI